MMDVGADTRNGTLGATDAAARRKQIDLAASTGAGLLGAGVGVLFANWLQPVGILLLVVGVILHGWGMLVRHRLERRGEVELPRWSVALHGLPAPSAA
jgi:hypothetical protein